MLLEPVETRRLLVTAATRQHAAAVTHMARLAYMQRHIDAAKLEVMLVGLLKHNACLKLLVQLPAAAQLSSEAVIRLLQAAGLMGNMMMMMMMIGETLCWRVLQV
jgi:hypothetical protein